MDDCGFLKALRGASILLGRLGNSCKPVHNMDVTKPSRVLLSLNSISISNLGGSACTSPKISSYIYTHCSTTQAMLESFEHVPLSH